MTEPDHSRASLQNPGSGADAQEADGLLSPNAGDWRSAGDRSFSFTADPAAFGGNPFGLAPLSATLANGSPLPRWLGFDPLEKTLSGTPPSRVSGTLQIVVKAAQAGGPSGELRFALSVFSGSGVTLTHVARA